jgi:hypothetical protein
MLARVKPAIAVSRTCSQAEARYVAAMKGAWDWMNTPEELCSQWDGGSWDDYQAVIDYLRLRQRTAPRG